MTTDTRHYDPTNIFARILRGELPAERLCEDDDTLALLDIMPRSDGHALVIPKMPARNMLDATPAQLAACLRTVQRVARAQIIAFNATGTTVQQFNEAAGGQVVFHLHYHVMPRHDGVPLRPPASFKAEAQALREHAARIRAVLKS